jgi:hypothetical protein
MYVRRLLVVMHCIRAVCVGWCVLPSRAGGRALGPIAWQAPEVCQLVTSGNELATMATTPSDVYMLGQCCDYAFQSGDAIPVVGLSRNCIHFCLRRRFDV